jgi:hypothetical protein
MISRKAKKRPSNLHYRSARAVPPLNSKGTDPCVSHRCKWNLIKGVIFTSGLCLLVGSLYLPFIVNETEENNKGLEYSPITAINGQLDEIHSVVEALENKVKNAVQKHGVKDDVNTGIKTGSSDSTNSAFNSAPVNLARGVSGLPMSETPSLIGATKGHVECDVDVDQLAYWNNQGKRDNEFKSPFIGNKGVSSIVV